MIIDFAIENFLSIREEQRFSFVASGKIKDLPENTIELSVPGMKGAKLLKSAVIYGANASGKTNVLKGLEFLRKTVILSHISLKPGQLFPLVPFKLDDHSFREPSRFEISFILDNVRHEFGFSLLPDKVIEEHLHSYPLGTRRIWFERSLIEDIYDYKYGTRFKKDDVIEEKTRPNALYLSTGAQLNHSDLKRIYAWFEGLQMIFRADPQETAEYVLDNKQGDPIAGLLGQADLGICDVRVNRIEIDRARQLEDVPYLEESVREVLRAVVRALESLEGEVDTATSAIGVLTTKIAHRRRDSGEEVLLDLTEESAGTQRYFSLLGPWLEALAGGRSICIDEIERSLHPLLSRRIIEGFHNPDLNKHGAQLLAATHDTTVLDQDLFRRDQIWFTEKDENGATVLYPLTDFTVRKGEALQKGYLAGRYGAIPMIGANISLNGPETAK